LVHRRGEGDAFPIRRERHLADAEVECGDTRSGAAVRGDGIDVRLRQLVVRLGDAVGGEVELRAVARPRGIVFIVLAGGELLRVDGLGGGLGNVYDPEVRDVFGVQITGAV